MSYFFRGGEGEGGKYVLHKKGHQGALKEIHIQSQGERLSSPLQETVEKNIFQQFCLQGNRRQKKIALVAKPVVA